MKESNSYQVARLVACGPVSQLISYVPLGVLLEDPMLQVRVPLGMDASDVVDFQLALAGERVSNIFLKRPLVRTADPGLDMRVLWL
jgi:hypothetical protein